MLKCLQNMRKILRKAYPNLFIHFDNSEKLEGGRMKIICLMSWSFVGYVVALQSKESSNFCISRVHRVHVILRRMKFGFRVDTCLVPLTVGEFASSCGGLFMCDDGLYILCLDFCGLFHIAVATRREPRNLEVTDIDGMDNRGGCPEYQQFSSDGCHLDNSHSPISTYRSLKHRRFVFGFH